ncbi:EbsA family protein [Limosilactobacillus ingluviei]|uniref:EbsA family protein n=1 Tax=Limosilactobacillus ingluviei TaxID=148604 RepID=UPI00195B5FBE|nr:EbsA family protein [Limosilactobacillus ingluviei]MBM6728299.1 VPDSG-CTERM exosortase interaction domain protein [Limosilactobacillus ingluviei]
MEEERKQYFYQPDMTTAIINWCWVLLILVVGIIIAFEYTYFQWVTATFIGVFLIIAGLSIFRRTLVVTPTKLVFSRVLQGQFMTIPIKDIRQPVFTNHTMTITVHGEVMTFSFSHRSLASLKAFLRAAQEA